MPALLPVLQQQQQLPSHVSSQHQAVTLQMMLPTTQALHVTATAPQTRAAAQSMRSQRRLIPSWSRRRRQQPCWQQLRHVEAAAACRTLAAMVQQRGLWL